MINIALVGYGYWGPNVAKQLYANKEYNFSTICDKKQARLEKAKNLYAESLSYTLDFDDVIADDEINAVALAVETSAHYDLARQAILAGKDIYVEKPFTDNVEQAIELQKLAQKKDE